MKNGTTLHLSQSSYVATGGSRVIIYYDYNAEKITTTTAPDHEAYMVKMDSYLLGNIALELHSYVVRIIDKKLIRHAGAADAAFELKKAANALMGIPAAGNTYDGLEQYSKPLIITAADNIIKCFALFHPDHVLDNVPGYLQLYNSIVKLFDEANERYSTDVYQDLNKIVC